MTFEGWLWGPLWPPKQGARYRFFVSLYSAASTRRHRAICRTAWCSRCSFSTKASAITFSRLAEAAARADRHFRLFHQLHGEVDRPMRSRHSCG